MEHAFRGALSRAAARVIGSRFAKPIARVVLAAAGLVLLAFIGKTAVAGAIGRSAPAGIASALNPASPDPSAQGYAPSLPATSSATATLVDTAAHAPSRTRASSDDPVVLNIAVEADLRRLPSIGAKRAEAILALRARLGRFRAVEDLLKVKGIGRATLKRLRPLLRLDPSPHPDAGLPGPSTSPGR
jgi:competence protein ComEA